MHVVHSAGIQDPAGAKLVLAKIVGRFPRLRLIWTDGANQPVVGWAKSFGGWTLWEIRCQVIILGEGNPVSVHHSCPKRRTDTGLREKANRHRITRASNPRK